jgi:hypothetical protein
LSRNGSIDRQHNLHRSYAHERTSGGRLCHCNVMALDPKWPSVSRNSSAGPVTDIHNFAKQTRLSQAPSGLAALGQTQGEHLFAGCERRLRDSSSCGLPARACGIRPLRQEIFCSIPNGFVCSAFLSACLKDPCNSAMRPWPAVCSTGKARPTRLSAIVPACYGARSLLTRAI